MELKLLTKLVVKVKNTCSNRTFMELKYHNSVDSGIAVMF